MKRLIIIHFIFFFVALFIAFVLVPLDRMFFAHHPAEEISKYYQDAIYFQSGKAWKIVTTWFIGLLCGRLMLKALTK
jgi:hypothetical protein